MALAFVKALGERSKEQRQRGQCGTAQLPEQGNHRDQTHRANNCLRQSALVIAEPPPRPRKHKREALCSLGDFGLPFLLALSSGTLCNSGHIPLQ